VARAALADAFLTRLRAMPGPALPVHDGAVPSAPPLPTPPYVVVHFRFFTSDGERAPGLVDVEERAQPTELRAYVHAVGGNARAAREVADRAYEQVFGWTPAVAGRECWPVRHDDSQPPDRDETNRLVVTAVDVYRLQSVPA
jgi:hypothetical protein